MLEISGAVAVITGAGSGIGACIADGWIIKGGRAVLADIDEKKLYHVAGELREKGGIVETVLCNVTSEEDTRRMAAEAIGKFGTINLVVPCAGITDDGLLLSIDKDSHKTTNKMSLEQFESVMDINVTGVFLTVRECGEQMINAGSRGLICLMSSVGALGTAGQLNYSSSKAAVSVMPKVITAEFFRKGVADRIRCVAVAPGYVDTPMITSMKQHVKDTIIDQVPIGRLIEPEEVASLVFELFKNEACAGETYFIHGGLRLGSQG